MKKKKYIQPNITCVELDNAISLALQSLPPDGPDEGPLGMNNQTFVQQPVV